MCLMLPLARELGSIARTQRSLAALLLKGSEPLVLVDDAIVGRLLPIANKLQGCSLVVVPVLKLLELEELFCAC